MKKLKYFFSILLLEHLSKELEHNEHLPENQLSKYNKYGWLK